MTKATNGLNGAAAGGNGQMSADRQTVVYSVGKIICRVWVDRWFDLKVYGVQYVPPRGRAGRAGGDRRFVRCLAEGFEIISSSPDPRDVRSADGAEGSEGGADRAADRNDDRGAVRRVARAGASRR